MGNYSERLSLIAEIEGSSRALSRKVDLPYRTVHNYVLGERDPGPEFLEALRVRMGISPLWVLTGEGPMLLEDAGQNEPPTAPVDPDLLRIQSALTTWWSSADDDERAWLKVQLRKHLPEVFKPQK